MTGTNDPAQSFDGDLAAIDFGSLLGGPLSAAITAQGQAAMVTLEFIERVGFESSGSNTSSTDKQIVNVTFSYTRTTQDPTTGQVTQQNAKLVVPILAIVPIPYIRVQQLSVDLNVKLNSIQRHQNSQSIVTNTHVGSGGGFLSLFSPVSFNVSVTSKSTSSSYNQITETYNYSVKMLAVQDEMPGGLSKVLSILENAILPTTSSGGNGPSPSPSPSP